MSPPTVTKELYNVSSKQLFDCNNKDPVNGNSKEVFDGENYADLGMGTKAIAIKLRYKGATNRPIVTPIYHSSIYYGESCTTFAEQTEKGYVYSRVRTPNSDELEMAIAQIENGAGTVVFPSGMAALTNTLMCFLKPDHIVAGSPLYSGIQHIFTHYFSQYNIEVSYVKAGDDVENYRNATKKNTKLYYGETISNPGLTLLDLEKFGRLGKEMGIMTMVDGTFTSPINVNVFEYDIDISSHSCTKYLGGHSDLVAGCTTFKDPANHDKLKKWSTYFGSCQSSFDSVLLLRSLKTLHIRVERHNENAMAVAKFLKSHPKVVQILYPGLQSHPQHELAKKLLTGFGGMMVIELTSMEACFRFTESTKLFKLAVSLGSVESLVEHVCTMTHGNSNINDEERKTHSISDTMIRLSVGIEDVKDLISDLRLALECV